MSNAVRVRRQMERMIVTQVVQSAIKHGYNISVNDGEETTLEHSTDEREILAVMFTTDEDLLFINSGDNQIESWIKFIYGNHGYDVIHDYTTNLEEMLTLANDMANKLYEGDFTIQVA